MISEILMPQGGQDLTTGRIVRWLVKENDPVKSGEVVCEVETEKAVFEVTSPRDGFILRIMAGDDTEVEILSIIGYVGDKDEKVPESTGAGSTKIVNPDSQDANKSAPSTETLGRSPRLVISPKARLLAKEHGIDIETLNSPRQDGKITFDDVLQVINNQSVSVPEHARVIHPDKMRKTIARRLSTSWQSAPHIFVTVDVDMTKALDWRKGQLDKKISINDLIIFACAKALKKYPEVNASFQDEDTIYYWDDFNIGVAVSTEGGLIVPAIEDADRLSIEQIGERSREITDKSRAGRQVISKPSRFTISNLGMYNVDSFTAVINPPEAAILAVSTVKKKPVVNEDGNIVVRDMMKLTLSLDHRVGDGVLAAQFLNELKQTIEEGIFHLE